MQKDNNQEKYLKEKFSKIGFCFVTEDDLKKEGKYYNKETHKIELIKKED